MKNILPLRVRSLARELIGRAGYEVRKRPRNPEQSRVFEDPYEAIFAQQRTMLCTLPIDRCVDKLGFCYGGWQPWVETVGQLLRDAEALDYGQSVFRAFYRKWSLPLLEGVFKEGIAAPMVRNHMLKYFHGCFQPFSRDPGTDLAKAVVADTNYLVSDNLQAGFPLSVAGSLNEDGTWSDRKGAVELGRLRRLLNSIRTSGYRRHNGEDGDIEGFLLRRDGSFRFVITRGLHRAAVLAALRHERLTLRLRTRFVIDIDSLPAWPLVRSGVWSPGDAAHYFRHLFDFDSDQWVRCHASSPGVDVSTTSNHRIHARK